VNLVNATLWDSATSSEYSADDNTNHYSTRNCTSIENGTEPPYSVYACSFQVQYYSNPSVWACKMRSYNSELTEISSEDTAIINSMLALELSEESLDFGTIFPGHESSQDINVTATNVGNVQIDVNVSGTNFSCTSGILGADYARFSDSPEQEYSSMTPLLEEPSILAIGIPQSDETEITILPIYWKISIPVSGLRGICTNTISLVAVQMVR
jgi:hypothetical protein